MTKLDTLYSDLGVTDRMAALEHFVFDGICPAICMNPGCDYTTEMEPDQDHGWCEECSTNSMQSALILEGLI
jgi:hypothetical protein